MLQFIYCSNYFILLHMKPKLKAHDRMNFIWHLLYSLQLHKVFVIHIITVELTNCLILQLNKTTTPVMGRYQGVLLSSDRLSTRWLPWPRPSTARCSRGWWPASTRRWRQRTRDSISSVYWISPASRSSRWGLPISHGVLLRLKFLPVISITLSLWSHELHFGK